MSKSGLPKAQELLWQHAEEIFERYKRNDFDIDEEKGKTMMSHTRTWREKNMLGIMKDKKEINRTILADVFTHSITSWETDRGNPYEWKTAATTLIEAYGFVRNYNAEVPGRVFAKQMKEKDDKIKSLQAQLDETNKRAETAEGRFRDCNEALLSKDHELADAKGELAAIRSQDIMRSLGGSAQSKVEPTDNPDEEKDDKQ